MLGQSKWIEFQEDTPEKWATKFWWVTAKEHGEHLGHVKWFGAWRRYVFYPDQATLFEQDCLRDIANFLEEQTQLHKESIKQRKEK